MGFHAKTGRAAMTDQTSQNPAKTQPFRFPGPATEIEAEIGVIMARAVQRELRPAWAIAEERRQAAAQEAQRELCDCVYGMLRKPNLDTELAERGRLKLSLVRRALGILEQQGFAIRCEDTPFGTIWERDDYQRPANQGVAAHH